MSSSIPIRLTREEENYYQIAWNLASKDGMRVTGLDFKDFMKDTQIEVGALAFIWGKADADKDGVINKQEFTMFLKCVAAYQKSPASVMTFNPFTSNDHTIPRIASVDAYMAKHNNINNQKPVKEKKFFDVFDNFSAIKPPQESTSTNATLEKS